MTPDGSLPPEDRQGDWYYVDAGDVQGPVSWWSLLNLLVSGEIPGDSLVWRLGMEDWARAHLLSEITSYLPPEVPKSPQVDDATTDLRPRVPESSVHTYEPQSHPNPPSGDSGRGVVALFVVAIVIVVGLLMNLEDDRSSQSSAATSSASEVGEELFDGALTGFPEAKQSIVYDYLTHFERVLSENLRVAALDSLNTYEAGRRAGMQWSRQGRRRLSDVKLSQLFRLESQILQAADKRLCGQIARGTAPQPDVWRATMTLDTGELRQVLDLRMQALQAELRSAPPRRPMHSDEAVTSAMAALLETMPRATEDSLLELLDSDSIPLDQECWGTRTMYEYVSQLKEPQRSIVTRYLLWLDTEAGVS